MNAWLAISMGVIFPTLCGALAAMALVPGPRNMSWLAGCTAVGFFLGVAMVGFGIMLGVALDLPSPHLLAIVVLAAALVGALGNRPWRGFETGAQGDSTAGRLLLLVLILLLLPNVYWAAGEILDRPLMGWDAWTVWSAKAKTWAGAGPGVDFVAVNEWITTQSPMVHTTPAAHYPELIGRFEYWVAHWAGGWNEHLVNFPWVFLWMALIVAFYSFLRRTGAGVVASCIATMILATAPFLSVHMAIPGYMDLWIAAEAMLACAVLASWTGTRSYRELFVATVFLAMLCATKVEGVIWAGIIVAAFGFAMMPGRWRAGTLAGALLGAFVWWLIGGVKINLGMHVVALTPELIDLPYIGRFELGFENRVPALLEALFVLPNWHVTAGLLLLAMVLGIAGFPSGPLKRACYAYIVLALGFLFVLFNLTPAGIWAESLTASNRLTLQMMPAAAWLLAANAARTLDPDFRKPLSSGD